MRILSLLMLCLAIGYSAQAQFNRIEDSFCSQLCPSSAVTLGNDIYIVEYDNSAQTFKLFKSDGNTVNGRALVKEIPPYGITTNLISVKTTGNIIFIELSYNGSNTKALWKSDGTASGTVEVIKDVSSLAYTASSGKIFYIENGYLKVFNTGVNLGTYTNLGSMVSDNMGGIYFSGDNKVYKSNGTIAGTTAHISNTSYSFQPKYLIGNNLYLGTSGNGFYKSDISISESFTFISNDSNIQPFYVNPTSGISYFKAYSSTGTSNACLMKTDGTSSGTVKIADYNIRYIGALGNELFFTKTIGGGLHKTDGTLAGSSLLMAGYFNSAASSNSVMYFWKSSINSEYNLWQTDGVLVNTTVVEGGGNITFYGTGSGGGPIGGMWFNNALYFNTVSGLHKYIGCPSLPNAPTFAETYGTVCKPMFGSTYEDFRLEPVLGAQSYEWSYTGSAIFSATTSFRFSNNVFNFTNGTSGTLSVRTVNGCGISPDSLNFDVLLKTLPIRPSFTPDGFGVTACPNKSLSIPVNVDPNVDYYNYQYSGIGVTYTGNGNPAILNFASNATSGTFTITPINECGAGPGKSKSVTITSPPPLPMISAYPTSINLGQQSALYSEYNSCAYGTSISWSDGTTATYGITVSPATTTTYTYTCQTICGEMVTSPPFTLVVGGCIDDLVISNTTVSPFQAAEYITTNGRIEYSEGSRLIYKAGNAITITPPVGGGYWLADNGAVFETKIEGCQ